MTKSWKVLLGVFIGAVAALVILFAEAPGKIEGPLSRDRSRETDVNVALPPPPETPEPETPPPPSADQLAALAPESFATESSLLDSGFGTTFGGGSGPGIRGGGGLGGDASQILAQGGETERGARVLSRPPLDYPPEAKARNVTGHVVLKILVGGSGQAEQILVQESEPRGFFDEAALRAVRQWKFEPALQKGKVASSWILQRIRFQMD